MTKNTLTVIFFTLLLLVIITGAVYLFLGINTPEAKVSEPAQTVDKANDTEETSTDSITLNVKQAEIQVESLQDLQNAVDFMEDNNIVREKFLFMKCPDCESGFDIQDCMDLLQDSKQNPEVLYMADSIGLDLDKVHRINKKHENNGIFCYYYI